jgi:hypothetical protein
MAELINRPPAGRIECLDYLLQNLVSRFKTNTEFTMNDAKFSDNRKNVHDHCKLLHIEVNLDIKYCPYISNPLSKAGCALTNSLVEDSQKQKAVSNTFNALHGLGLIERGKNTSKVTSRGERLSKLDYASKEAGKLITESVSQYGPLVGMLGWIHTNKLAKFSTSSIPVGYPNSGDQIEIGKTKIEISVGSQDDSNTRTRSVLLAWAVAGGFIQPIDWKNSGKDSPHMEFQEYMLKEKRNDKFYIARDSISDFFSRRVIIERPLDYEHLVKDVNALREKGQKQIRDETKKVVAKIRNRRFAIIYLLNNAFTESKLLNFGSLLEFLSNHESLFVINSSQLKKVMTQELNVAFSAGIPFSLKGNDISPLNGVNRNELIKSAPSRLVEVLEQYDN